MVFLTSRNASSFGSWCRSYSQRRHKGEIHWGSDLVCTLRSIVRDKSRVSLSLARCQTNAAEFAAKVCFSLFDGLEVLAQLMS